MTFIPPPARRRVNLRISYSSPDLAPQDLVPSATESLDVLLARASALGLPLHHDPQIAGLLVALKLRDEVPTLLYAAASCVLAAVYDAAEE